MKTELEKILEELTSAVEELAKRVHNIEIRETGEGVSAADSLKVKATTADIVPDYLQDKLAAGTGVSLALLNPGGDEQVEITASGADDKRVKVSTDDTTPDFIEGKIVAGAGISITTLNPAGDEDLQISNTLDTFLELTDTPGSYSSQGTKIVGVNSGETALEFVTKSSAPGASAAVLSTDVNGLLTLLMLAVGSPAPAPATGEIIASIRLFVNDDTNTKQIRGLTLNQGVYDDEIVSLKSDDVAHGVTTETETDTYALFKKFVADNGGLQIRGLTEDKVGAAIDGVAVTGDTAKDNGAVAPVILRAYKKSGTTVGNLAANENVLAVINNATALFAIDADGDVMLIGTGDLFNVPWTDYSGISTIVGWSSFTTQKIFYKKIGKLIFVEFSISGTSNSTSAYFTLPFDRHNNAYSLKVPMQITDSGSVQLGLFEIATNGGTVTCYSTIGEAGWTATGTKGVIGQFWFEVS